MANCWIEQYVFTCDIIKPRRYSNNACSGRYRYIYDIVNIY